MTTIDLSNPPPAPTANAAKLAKRPVPCAGLFGYRKDGVSEFDVKVGQPTPREHPAA